MPHLDRTHPRKKRQMKEQDPGRTQCMQEVLFFESIRVTGDANYLDTGTAWPKYCSSVMWRLVTSLAILAPT